jgi:peptide/nickel transport system substrate-binding protein
MPFFPSGDATFVLDPVFTAWIFGQSKGVANRNAYENPEFDKVISDALMEYDNKKRFALINKAQTLHANDNSWVMLYYPGIHQAMKTCISGWIWNPDDWPRFADLSCKKK